MHRLLLDTNTVMALWFFEDPGLSDLRAFIASGHAQLVARDDALEELRRVLAYRQFACEVDRQTAIHATYSTLIESIARVEDGDPLPKCRDADDQKFLEIARDGQVQWLLTRDKALLRCGRHRLVRDRFAILTPERWQKEVLPNLDHDAAG